MPRRVITRCCGRTMSSNKVLKKHEARKRCPFMCKHCQKVSTTKQNSARHELVCSKNPSSIKAGKASVYENVLSEVMKLSGRVERLETANVQLKTRNERLSRRCDKYEKRFERIHGSLKHQARNMDYLGFEGARIADHFDRMPTKINVLNEKVENLEVLFDKRKKRVGPSIFYNYKRPEVIPQSERVNGPEFKCKGGTLGTKEAELIESIAITFSEGRNLSEQEWKARVRTWNNLERTLKSHKYTWPTSSGPPTRPRVPSFVQPV